ncbi:MAG: 6,7-dimethyl-8-ribityllumazine synthase [Betaproteobacteria bacterium]|nr:6,7-dimethyl-8-ribityllumazine synthase [Betaproteobacteria bacterium]
MARSNTYDGIEEFEPDHKGEGLRIGIVVGRFNNDIGEGLLSSCTAQLAKFGVKPRDMRIATVPGALEIALVLQKMAQSGGYDALIALGAVIRGETYHFEIVSNESCAGITRVQLDTGIPIANGILTTEDDDQALARMAQKGADCALAAVEMANLLRKIK